MQRSAVFLILWTPELEHAEPYQQDGLVMRHRPLAYWLDYLRAFAGVHSPIVVIQSRCDSPSQRVHIGATALTGFTSLRVAEVSAKTGLGLDLVRASLKEAVRDCMERRPPAPIGAGRARVRDQLRKLVAADQNRPPHARKHRWLDRKEFDQLCREVGGISDTEALLEFLEQSGVSSYRPGLFAGRIVLDQNWALGAMYALFDRRKIVPLLWGRGRFRRSDLDVLRYGPNIRQEQLVFLQMMEVLRICFRAMALGNGEWEYIAPDLLPRWSDAQESLLAGRLLQVPPNEKAEANYGFLHEGSPAQLLFTNRPTGWESCNILEVWLLVLRTKHRQPSAYRRSLGR